MKHANDSDLEDDDKKSSSSSKSSKKDSEKDDKSAKEKLNMMKEAPAYELITIEAESAVESQLVPNSKKLTKYNLS